MTSCQECVFTGCSTCTSSQAQQENLSLHSSSTLFLETNITIICGNHLHNHLFKPSTSPSFVETIITIHHLLISSSSFINHYNNHSLNHHGHHLLKPSSSPSFMKTINAIHHLLKSSSSSFVNNHNNHLLKPSSS
ncbi:hypothetical protein BgiBS90_014894 [Biomphalaria glabrata]|nr:hypothetical protein BgiBS90_014894 [Biomphalaria glabrata]